MILISGLCWLAKFGQLRQLEAPGSIRGRIQIVETSYCKPSLLFPLPTPHPQESLLTGYPSIFGDDSLLI